MHFEPGDRIDGLNIEKELGRGAYGVVYLARDTLLGRLVALKVLPGTGADVPEPLREAVLTEARLIANLNSPHVVTLYRLHPSSDGGWMQEMEFVEGGCLDDIMEEGEPLPLDSAVDVFRGVCRALKAAHGARILHGDIKPGNVLFGKDNLVKLADFGLARMIEGTGQSVELEGQVVGTPLYMAPEVITGQEAGMASDLWSAATLFYQLLCGRMPFPATHFGELMQGIIQKPPEPLDEAVPKPIADLVLRCLEKAAEDRPATAAEVLTELDGRASIELGLAPAAAPAERRTNLTAPVTSFIGREAEITGIGTLLQEESVRLVNLLGPGGIGKTRLSKQICRSLLGRFEGGCWFADLSEVEDADGISAAVAEALGVPLSGKEDPAQSIGNALEYRKPMLLVLDNFEQVLEHAGTTVGSWLLRAPQVKFLITSRALLGLAGERQYELHPLPTPGLDTTLPGTASAAIAYAGVQLFVDRAREVKPQFELDDENATEVVRICAELDGMPLAIELAAARAKIMKPSQIARKLNQKFQLLQSTRRDLTPRQKTLMGAISWSFDLLEDWERAAFLQACTFRDGFTLEAAEAILDLSEFEDAPLAMDIAQSLREKSLLTAYDTGIETRLGMYRSIRDYGRRKLLQEMEEAHQLELEERHAEYYLEYAEEWNQRIPGMRDQEALDRIALEVGNLSAVQERALARNDLEVGVRAGLAAAETMKVRRPPRQLIPLLERSLQALGDERPVEAARLRTHLSAACQLAGDWDRAVAEADAAVELAREVGDPRTLVRALLQQGEMRRNRGELDTALVAFEESDAIARDSGDRHALAVCTGEQGMVIGQKGDLESALAHFKESEGLAREVGDNLTLALSIGNRGVVSELHGDVEDAIACYREAENISRRIGNLLRVAVTLGNHANALVQSGDLEAGLRCYREGEAIARELGAKQRIAQIVSNRGTVHTMRDEWEEALACYAEAEGIARELGDQRGLAVTLGQQARALARQENWEEAELCYRRAAEFAERIGDRMLVAHNLCQRGSLYSAQERWKEAREALDQGIVIFDEMGANENQVYFAFKASQAGANAALGDPKKAAQLAEEAKNLARRLGLTEHHPDKGVREGLVLLREFRPKPM